MSHLTNSEIASELNIPLESLSDVVYVINRLGKPELLDTNKIVHRINKIIDMYPKINHINPFTLMQKVIAGLPSGITTYEIDEYTANTAASLSIEFPPYLKVAGRLAIDNHQKNTQRSFRDKTEIVYKNKIKKIIDGKEVYISHPLVNSEYRNYVETHQDFIESIIDYTSDFKLDFFGFRTFQNIYSLKINEVPIERPQDMYMRTAISLHMNKRFLKQYSTYTVEDELDDCRDTYLLLSEGLYTHASPTYFNAGGNHQQYASCFLMGTHDSCEGIMKSASDMASISKWAGGIGIHVNELRSTGSIIKGTNGKSSGIVPWIQLFQCTLNGFNQGGRRPGKAAIYMMPHHPDFMKFIQLGRNDGTESNRARDMFYAVWLPDIFMERVRMQPTDTPIMWSFFDPYSCEDLSNYTGEEYTKKYLELERKKLYSFQLPVRDIWNEIYKTNKDVGNPYVCFSDNANKQFMQKNLGILKSSNLCSEITIFSNKDEYGVCVLSSISLTNLVCDSYSKDEMSNINQQNRILNHEFPINPYFDYTKLIEITKTVVNNLNLIIDKTFYPTEETKRSNLLHRPIGIGIQGLANVYAKMRYPFESTEAMILNKKIFETIYYAALSQSTKLSKIIYKNACAIVKEKGKYEHTKYNTDYTTTTVVYENISDIPCNIGSYPSYLWNGGSPISKGTFHWELLDLKTDDLLTKDMYDWESLRQHILKFGIMNSLTTALMPTASTSQLLGNNECFEPFTSNLYLRKTQVGEFTVMNKYLINDLYTLNLWNKSMKEMLVASNGSIQYIDGLPDEFKKLYKTSWEMDQKNIIQQAIDRQPFIDQAQSLNWYIPNVSLTEWNKLLFQAWKGGLPTGKYYLHSRATVDPQKFSISVETQEKFKKLLQTGETTYKQPDNICDVCGA